MIIRESDFLAKKKFVWCSVTFTAILILALSSCSHGQEKEIVPLNFLDSFDYVYAANDTSRTNPKKVVWKYFYTNIDDVKTEDAHIMAYVGTDSSVQRAILQKTPQLNLIFFRSGDCVKRIIKKKSSDVISDCNEDLVVELVWRYGILRNKFYYKNGRIDSDIKVSPIVE